MGALPLPDAIVELLTQVIRYFTRDYLNGHHCSLSRPNFEMHDLISLCGGIITLIGSDRKRSQTQLIRKNRFRPGVHVEPYGLEIFFAEPCDIGHDDLWKIGIREKGIAPRYGMTLS